MTTRNLRILFATEVDLKQVGGAVTTDTGMIQCLREFGDLGVFYMEKERFRSMVAALLAFVLGFVRNLRARYVVCFSRGLITSTLLVLFRPFTHTKVVHQALSVPLPSKEIHYMPHGGLEAAVRFYVFHFLEKNVLPRVDAITVASKEYVDELVEIGVRRKNVRIVPFSVEDAFFQQPFKERKSDVFTFCYTGRFHLYHVLVPLIQAFELLTQGATNVELLLVGEGPSFPQVEKAVAEKGLANKVKLVGMVSHSDLPHFLSSVDCFVLLSRAPGLPIGILEAAAAGRPIITLKRKDDEILSRYFEHGKEIYMVDNDSPDEIAKSMQRLYEDSDLRKTLAYGARKAARQYFSKEATIHTLRNVLADLSK